jgi:hypothetical protein
VISRYLVITLSFGAAFYRLSQGAWLEAIGLLGLGGGLLCLKLAERWPPFKRVAWVGFGLTALAIAGVLLRMAQGR